MRATNWPTNELNRIDRANDLHIAPLREDGVEYGTPTFVWSVVVDDALYVRAYNGRHSSWYQAALRQKAGRIRAAGFTKEVMFAPVDGTVNASIDDAYRTKYRDSRYLSPMVGVRARGATILVIPQMGASLDENLETN